MATKEAIGACPIYKEHGGRKTPDNCKLIAEATAAIERNGLLVAEDSGDPEFDKDFCRPIEDCLGNPFHCCNPDVIRDLFDITKH